MAAYAVHFIEQPTETDTPIPELYELFVALLEYLGSHPPSARTVYAFELKVLACLGMEPDPAGAAELAHELLDTDWMDVAGLTAETADVRALRQFLHGFLIFNVGKLPKGREDALHPVAG